MYCVKCGRYNYDENKYCTYCGEKLETSHFGLKNKSKQRGIDVILIVLVIVFLVCGFIGHNLKTPIEAKPETEETKATVIDLWTSFDKVDVTGMTAGEIDSKYGLTDHLYDISGGSVWDLSKLDIDVNFPIIFDTNGSPIYDIDSLIKNNPQCLCFEGCLKDVFGINEAISVDDFAEKTGVNFNYNKDDSEYGKCYYSEDILHNGDEYSAVISANKLDNVNIFTPETFCSVLNASARERFLGE